MNGVALEWKRLNGMTTTFPTLIKFQKGIRVLSEDLVVAYEFLPRLLAVVRANEAVDGNWTPHREFIEAEMLKLDISF